MINNELMFSSTCFPNMCCIGAQGNQVAVGTHKGLVQVWDVASSKRVCILNGHTARVGALAWNGDVLSSGSRDRLILQRDVRTPCIIPDRRLAGHRQEVRERDGGGV